MRINDPEIIQHCGGQVGDDGVEIMGKLRDKKNHFRGKIITVT